MGEKLNKLNDKLITFIEQQKIFFVATADVDGRVNLSPKGGDSLRVINQSKVVWQNLTGSGNETVVHMQAVNRITIMFCAFEGKPLILRLYGRGKAIKHGDKNWLHYENMFPKSIGSRQFFDIDVDLVQTSCGFQVPFFDYNGERDLLKKWSDAKGIEGIKKYWQDKNSTSIDGKPIEV